MKKNFLICLWILLSYHLCNGQKLKTVIVTNTQEFIKAIAPHTIIRLKTDKLVLSDINFVMENTYLRLQQVPDGFALEISEVKNLKIIGINPRPTKILTNSRFAYALHFKNCEEIGLENVEVGNALNKGYSTGGTLLFVNCKNIQILNTTVLGGGTEGLTFFGVVGSKIQNLTIRNCTQSTLTLRNTRDVEFINSRFSNNQAYDLINVFESENIFFTNCMIDFNHSGKGDITDNYALLNVPRIPGLKKSFVTLRRCIIEDNHLPYFCRSSESITTEDCRIANNIFEKGYSSDNEK